MRRVNRCRGRKYGPDGCWLQPPAAVMGVRSGGPSRNEKTTLEKYKQRENSLEAEKDLASIGLIVFRDPNHFSVSA